jgi:hypothetical protein
MPNQTSKPTFILLKATFVQPSNKNISEESQKPLGVWPNGWAPHGRPFLVLPLLDHRLELFQRLIKPLKPTFMKSFKSNLC